jgi:hypothetical protein
MPKSRRIVLLGVPLVLATVVVARIYTLRVAAAQTPNYIDVPLPAAWVPFTADVVTNMDGSIEGGTFHRNSDGSMAWIMNSRMGELITIHNRKTKSTYVRLGDQKGWVRMPISQGLSRPPDRVIRVRADRARKLTELLEGFETWEIVAIGRGGMVTTRRVPALNGFTVYSDQIVNQTGRYTQEFTNIRLGEPPAVVFLPPPGTYTEEQTGPMPRLPSK